MATFTTKMKKIKIDTVDKTTGEDKVMKVQHYRINIDDSITGTWFSFHCRRVDEDGVLVFGWSKSSWKQITNRKNDIDDVDASWDEMAMAMGKFKAAKLERTSTPVSRQFVADELYRMGCEDAIAEMRACMELLFDDLEGKIEWLYANGYESQAWVAQECRNEERIAFDQFDASW